MDAKKVTLYLQKVPLNRGGYDSFGTYWGVGAPLYRAEWSDHERTWTDWFRARIPALAKFQAAEAFKKWYSSGTGEGNEIEVTFYN